MEQLHINYCNEKLQQLFIELTLRAEQNEYAKEGIKWETVNYFDNEPVVKLIESKRPIGILALLDEESVMPRATDEVRACESRSDKRRIFVFRLLASYTVSSGPIVSLVNSDAVNTTSHATHFACSS